MKARMLGPLEVSEIGFGTMSFASSYGEAPSMQAAVEAIVGDRLPPAWLDLSYR